MREDYRDLRIPNKAAQLQWDVCVCVLPCCPPWPELLPLIMHSAADAAPLACFCFSQHVYKRDLTVLTLFCFISLIRIVCLCNCERADEFSLGTRAKKEENSPPCVVAWLLLYMFSITGTITAGPPPDLVHCHGSSSAGRRVS